MPTSCLLWQCGTPELILHDRSSLLWHVFFNQGFKIIDMTLSVFLILVTGVFFALRRENDDNNNDGNGDTLDIRKDFFYHEPMADAS